MSKKINGLKGNTKGLYKLTVNLTDASALNPMPPGKTDAQLAEEFAEFFIDKIYRIRQHFLNIDAYVSETCNTPQLRRFSPMTESEVEKIINSMQSKLC